VVTKQFELFEMEGLIRLPTWIQKIDNNVYFITDNTVLNVYDIGKQN